MSHANTNIAGDIDFSANQLVGQSQTDTLNNCGYVINYLAGCTTVDRGALNDDSMMGLFLILRGLGDAVERAKQQS